MGTALIEILSNTLRSIRDAAGDRVGVEQTELVMQGIYNSATSYKAGTEFYDHCKSFTEST